ncbi:hypothetical protein SDC9_152071 [bioreactor metagenome]|uniref:Uncharacterized protein n=1 Tax=bioreactor metagenome TaxID=1076179 RepID=A0A645EWE8_9ZZZZ
MLGDGDVDVVRDHAGFDDDHHVVVVDFEDLVHAFVGDDDAAEDGNRAARQAAPGPVRGDRDEFRVRELHDLGDLLRGPRSDDDLRHVRVLFDRRLVVGERLHLFLARDDVARADDRGEPFDDFGCHLVVVHLEPTSLERRSFRSGRISKRSPTMP